jgi:predicted dehydrogenase
MSNTIDKPILIVGYGSIGRRHLRNLRDLGYKNLFFYRTGKSILPDDEILDIPIEYDLRRALARKPEATIVANPTALHMSVALAAAKSGSHLFLEKPISHTMDGVEELRKIIRKDSLIVVVGFQFRFHPLLKQIKKLLDLGVIGSVVSVQAHWGEYLPQWHPEEDYHQSYSAKKELGGGVILTLCHPFDYLRWLLGEVSSVLALQSQSNGLGIDVEESADVLLQFTCGAVGNVHLDYTERPSEHFLRIIGQKGVIYWSNSDGMLKYSILGKKWKKLLLPKGFERNTLFLDEMRHFTSCISGNEQILCSFDDGVAALKIALAAKRSLEEKRLIQI